jgi:hypothetical protein
MSLTSELDDAKSPLAAFMSAGFPQTRDLSASLRAACPSGAEPLRPEPPDGQRIAWGTLGAAIDHRLRYAFSNSREPSESVQHGMATAPRLARPDARHAIRQARDELALMLSQVIAKECPADRARPVPLPPRAEAELARICYAMAWFEEVYRSQRLWPGTPLGDARPDLTIDQLLAAVPVYAVDDITAQVKLADPALTQLRATHPPEQVHAGPTFAGSPDVDGADADADADMIIDDLLIEIKSTATPSRLGKRDFYQALGYVILDYDNRYRIGRLGFYLTRFGRLITWTVEEYLTLLGSQRSLDEQRRACAATLATS